MKNLFQEKLLIIAVSLPVLLLSGCFSAKEKSGGEKPLNFIVIYTDEMEFNDLGCYRGDIPTPHIDQLASEGILFRSAYTTASMCTPSRYSVITGQFPGRCTAPSFLQENQVSQSYNIAWNAWVTADKKYYPGY